MDRDAGAAPGSRRAHGGAAAHAHPGVGHPPVGHDVLPPDARSAAHTDRGRRARGGRAAALRHRLRRPGPPGAQPHGARGRLVPLRALRPPAQDELQPHAHPAAQPGGPVRGPGGRHPPRSRPGGRGLRPGPGVRRRQPDQHLLPGRGGRHPSAPRGRRRHVQPPELAIPDRGHPGRQLRLPGRRAARPPRFPDGVGATARRPQLEGVPPHRLRRPARLRAGGHAGGGRRGLRARPVLLPGRSEDDRPLSARRRARPRPRLRAARRGARPGPDPALPLRGRPRPAPAGGGLHPGRCRGRGARRGHREGVRVVPLPAARRRLLRPPVGPVDRAAHAAAQRGDAGRHLHHGDRRHGRGLQPRAAAQRGGTADPQAPEGLGREPPAGPAHVGPGDARGLSGIRLERCGAGLRGPHGLPR